MYSLEMNTSTYIIPLDHIDIKTIHTRLEQNAVAAKPLWNCPRNDQEYYSFELIARNTGCKDLEANRTSADYPTVTCHICNIEVPAIYIMKHNVTEKHNICLKIADTALQRVKDQMFMDTEPSLTDTVPGYYCEPCSMIVTEEDHDATDVHKSSMLHDKLLKDLLMIYSDKDNINKIDIKLPDSETKDLDVDKYPTGSKHNDLISDISQINNIRKKRTRTRKRHNKGINIHDYNIGADNDSNAGVENDTNVGVDNDCNVSAENDNNVGADNDNKIVDDDLKSIKNYIKTLIEMFPKTPMEYKHVNENFIQINIDGHKKLLYVDNFLGIDRDSNKCLMCSNPVIDVSLEDHIYDFYHMKNVMAPVTDQYCLRQINDCTYYCLLCACKITGDNKTINLIHYLITNHITSKTHTVNDRGALISNNEYSSFDDEKATPINEDDECNDKNEMADAKTNKENNSRVISADMGSGAEYYRGLVARFAEAVYGDSDDEVEHYKGRIGGFVRTRTRICDWKEFRSYDDIITHDETSQPDTDIAQSVHTDDSSVTQITSNASITEDLNYQVRVTSNPKEVSCKVCDVILPNTPINIKGHTTGNKHKDKYRELLTLNKIKYVNNKNFCDFCQVQVPNKNELEHISGRNHQAELLADKKKKEGVVSNVVDDQNQKKVVVPVIEQKKTYCDVCAMHIFTSNFDSHINGAKHKQMAAARDKMTKAVQTFVQAIQSKLADAETKNQNKTYCNACAVYIDTHNFNQHINGGKHKQMAAASNKLSNVVQTFAQAIPSNPVAARTEPINNLANSVETGENSTKNNETNTYQAQENFLYQMKSTDNIKSLFCRLCEVKVPNMPKDVKIHVNGFNHQNTYSILLTSNKVRKDGDRFICDVCKVTVTRRNEIDHIHGKNHRNNIKKDREQTN